MLTRHSRSLKRLFVGRKEELELLQLAWEETLEPEEHQVYVVLNAPGTGKTRLLQHFGELLEKQHEGLYFHYRCSDRFRSSTELNVDLIKKLLNNLKRKESYLVNYFLAKHVRDESNARAESLHELMLRMESMVMTQKISRSDVVSFFEDVSMLIPLFFVSDEIQQFQKRVLKVLDEDASVEPSMTAELASTEILEETALRYFTRILSDLMTSPVLMILSGTQYHILSQIGMKIGSPIAGKVRQLLIKNFTRQELEEYVIKVNDDIIREIIPPTKHTHAKILVAHYHRFLQSFSGGHPRTVVLITEQFLINILSFLDKDLSYDEFMDIFYPIVENDFKGRIFSREKQDHIRLLQDNEHFHVVKEWILNHSLNGLNLGPEPSVSSDIRDHVEDLIFQLLTLGVIVRNGVNQYHLTSFFHLQSFLECYTNEHEQFLHQVFTNRFFKLLCGSHAGFGYTFEHVIIAALIVNSHKHSKNRKNMDFGVRDVSWDKISSSLRKLQTVKEITSEIDWEELVQDLKPNVLYHAPRAQTIDLLVLIDDTLILIQVTTTKMHHASKIRALERKIEAVQQFLVDKKVLGWYISLFPLNKQGRRPANDRLIVITAGSDLEALLGTSLLERLTIIKEQLH